MMRVVVIGGSGVAGAYTVAAVEAAGHSVQAVSRRNGVDVRTGSGLDQALIGVDVVIDTLNTTTFRRSRAVGFFTTAARGLQAAAARQGVGHIVSLSILGVDRVRGYAYYDAKLAQERELRSGEVPVTVLRATQFHEFPAQLLARLRVASFAVVPHIRSQPVAARTVGQHLARLAVERPGGIVELAGPEVHDIADLARRVVRQRREKLHVIPLSPPGKAARDMRAGALLAAEATVVDGPSYDDWLQTEDAARLELRRGAATPRGLHPAAST